MEDSTTATSATSPRIDDDYDMTLDDIRVETGARGGGLIPSDLATAPPAETATARWTVTEYLLLPANARVSVYFEGNMDSHGFLGLKKL